MIKYHNICTKKTFVSNGVEKTKWLNVGTLKEMDDGKKFIELNILPNETLFVFEQTDKAEQSPVVAETNVTSPAVEQAENIPF